MNFNSGRDIPPILVNWLFVAITRIPFLCFLPWISKMSLEAENRKDFLQFLLLISIELFAF
jgi:hypothetical protein